MKHALKRALNFVLFAFLQPILWFLCLIARYCPKKIDVGIGPLPLINNLYFKKALESAGYSAETFVDHTYFITNEFDINLSHYAKNTVRLVFCRLYLFVRALFTYRCLYLYYDGFTQGVCSILRPLEPYFFRLAKIKTIIMPYGGDVDYSYHMTNLWFKHAQYQDYPGYRRNLPVVNRNIKRWVRHGDVLIAQHDCVHYLPCWTHLASSLICIDTKACYPEREARMSGTFKIFHAPNHKQIKGTQFFEKAVSELKQEGLDIELIVVTGVSNAELKRQMQMADVIADQLLVGWYAMFAIEGMSMGKPVLCYLDEKVNELMEVAGVYDMGENPIVNCTPYTVKENIRALYNDRALVKNIGLHSRAFAEKYHSIEACGKKFCEINESIGIKRS